jgi:hypothetical protein
MSLNRKEKFVWFMDDGYRRGEVLGDRWGTKGREKFQSEKLRRSFGRFGSKGEKESLTIDDQAVMFLQSIKRDRKFVSVHGA